MRTKRSRGSLAVQRYTLALTSPRQEVRQAWSNQTTGHPKALDSLPRKNIVKTRPDTHTYIQYFYLYTDINRRKEFILYIYIYILFYWANYFQPIGFR